MAQWQHDWDQLFPALSEETESVSRLKTQLQLIELPANQQVFQPGSACENFLMVIDGTVKVTLTGASGKDLVLYRVERGGTCILTTACLFSDELYPAHGETESPVTALAMSSGSFHKALADCPEFRNFVFSSLGFRFSDLMARIESVSFKSINCRLASTLLDLQDSQQCVHTTHQNLATELGSAREVISRHLKQFEKKGWIEQSRSNIQIKDIAALSEMADQDQ